MSLAWIILAATARTLPAPAPPPPPDTAHERHAHPKSEDPTVLDQVALPEGGFAVLREGTLSIEHAATAPLTREVPASSTRLVLGPLLGVRDGAGLRMFDPVTLADAGYAWDTDRWVIAPRVTTRLLPYGATKSDPQFRASEAAGARARIWWSGLHQVVRRHRIDIIGAPTVAAAEGALSPDGRRLARLEGDATLRVYDTTSGRETCALPRATWKWTGSQHPPAWSNDGRTVWWFSPAGEIAQVDARTCAEVFRTTLEPTGPRGLFVKDLRLGDWWAVHGLTSQTWLNPATAELITFPCTGPLAVSASHITCIGSEKQGWPLLVYARGSDAPPRELRIGEWRPLFSADGTIAIAIGRSNVHAYNVATGDLIWELTDFAERPQVVDDLVVTKRVYTSRTPVGGALMLARYRLHLLPHWRSWDVYTGHRVRAPREVRDGEYRINEPSAAAVQAVLRADDAALALVSSRWTWTFDLERRKVAVHRSHGKLADAFPEPLWVGPQDRNTPGRIIGDSVTVGTGAWDGRTVTRDDGTTVLSAWTATDGSFTAWWDDATVECHGDVGCVGWWLLPDGTSRPLTDRHHQRWHPRRAKPPPDWGY